LCYIGFIQSHDADRDVVDKFDDALHCVSQAFVAGGLPAQGKEKGESESRQESCNLSGVYCQETSFDTKVSMIEHVLLAG